MVLPSHFFKNFYAEKVNEIGCVYDELRLPCCGPLRCAPLFCRRAERTLIVKKHMKRNSILLTALLVIVVATLLVYGVFSASGTPPSDLSEMSGGASPGAASETGSTGSSQAPSDLPSESSGGDSGTVAPGETRISFLACPDNIIHPSVYYDAIRKAAQANGSTPVYTSLATGKYDFADMYEYVADAIRDADISYVNVETLIGGNDNKISGYPMFNTPEQAGEQLIALGFDIYNLAHNHMLDSNSDEYLINCNRFFESRGLTTLGYYKDQADVSNIKIIEHEGVKIAFLAYTYSTNGLSLQAGSSTVIPYISESLITQQMELAKAQADLVFVSMHWGDEDRYEVNAQQRSTAQLLVDLGADVIIGMHPHVIQEMKWVEREDGGRCLLTIRWAISFRGCRTGSICSAVCSRSISSGARTGRAASNHRSSCRSSRIIRRRLPSPATIRGIETIKSIRSRCIPRSWPHSMASRFGTRPIRLLLSAVRLRSRTSSARSKRIFPPSFLPIGCNNTIS